MMGLLACHAPEPAGRDTPVDDTAVPTDTATTGRPILVTVPDAADADTSDAIVFDLTAAAATHSIGGATYAGYAYNGGAPGPTLRARVGDTVTVRFRNELDAETTVHWHGLAVPNAMDGVSWVSAPLPPRSDFTYTLPMTRAGTFWYHPHIDTDHQVDLGLYGPFVVEDPTEPAADRELIVVFDSWGEATVDDAHGLTNPEDAVWTANGRVDPAYPATAGERIRVRMVNAANTAYLDIGWPGLRQIAGDQGLDATNEVDRVLLAPGDRAEFEWLVAGSFDVTTLPYVAAGGSSWGDERRLFSVEAAGSATAPEPTPWPFPTESVSPDPGRTDLTYVFAGDGTAEWLINGEAWPDITVSTATLGSPTVIEARNLSATEHPFHLHGHAFEVLSVDGVAPQHRMVEDTFNLAIRGTARFLLNPDNPGDWMLHCHLLAHEEGGMMTVLRVE